MSMFHILAKLGAFVPCAVIWLTAAPFSLSGGKSAYKNTHSETEQRRETCANACKTGSQRSCWRLTSLSAWKLQQGAATNDSFILSGCWVSQKIKYPTQVWSWIQLWCFGMTSGLVYRWKRLCLDAFQPPVDTETTWKWYFLETGSRRSPFPCKLVKMLLLKLVHYGWNSCIHTVNILGFRVNGDGFWKVSIWIKTIKQGPWIRSTNLNNCILYLLRLNLSNIKTC